MDKGSGSVFFPVPDPGDPKRPHPTASGSGSATLLSILCTINSRNEVFTEIRITEVSVIAGTMLMNQLTSFYLIFLFSSARLNQSTVMSLLRVLLNIFVHRQI